MEEGRSACTVVSYIVLVNNACFYQYAALTVRLIMKVLLVLHSFLFLSANLCEEC